MPEVEIRVRDGVTNEAVPRADIGLFVRVNEHDDYSLMRGTANEAGVGHFQIGGNQQAEIFIAVRCRGYAEWRDFVADWKTKLTPRTVPAGETTCIDGQL